MMMSSTFIFKLNKQKTKTKLKLSFIANIFRTTEITWSTLSLLILKEYQAIIHPQTSFGSFEFLLSLLVSCFHNSNVCFCHRNSSTYFFKKLNLLSFEISITCSILSSFHLALNDLRLKISQILILQGYYLVFLGVFSTKPCNRRLSSSLFLLLFFFIEQSHLFVTWFCYIYKF